jgi:hypothetical protein
VKRRYRCSSGAVAYSKCFVYVGDAVHTSSIGESVITPVLSRRFLLPIVGEGLSGGSVCADASVGVEVWVGEGECLGIRRFMVLSYMSSFISFDHSKERVVARFQV